MMRRPILFVVGGALAVGLLQVNLGAQAGAGQNAGEDEDE